MKRELNALDKFLTSDYETQFELLADSATRAAVEAWMGTAALGELLDHAPDKTHLGAGSKNIVFAPGVMGSTLQSDGLGGVWWLDIARARDKLNQLQLTDDSS